MLLLAPGGLVTRKLARDGDPIVDWIRRAHPHTDYTASVCTGVAEITEVVRAILPDTENELLRAP